MTSEQKPTLEDVYKLVDRLALEQFPELIKGIYKTEAEKNLSDTTFSDNKTKISTFLHNPQNEGLWTLDVDIDLSSNSDEIRQLIGWDYREDDWFMLARGPELFKKIFDFLFELLPANDKKKLREKEELYTSNPFNPFRRRSFFRRKTAKESQKPQMSTSEKRKYCVQYKPSLDIYKENLTNFQYYESDDDDESDTLFNFSEELMVRIKKNTTRSYQLFSLDKSILEIMRKLLNSLNLNQSNNPLTKLVRPEKELMLHYIHVFVSSNWQEALDNTSVSEAVRISLEEFGSSRFTYSVRSSGLAMEEFLVEIYETFLRKTAPHGEQATLTHIVENLNHESRLLFESNGSDNSKKSQSLEFERINKIIENAEKSQNSEVLEFSKILRQMLQNLSDLSKDKQKEKKKEDTKSLFPFSVSHAIKNTTKLRNDVSHRSQSRIGQFEAARALQGVYILSMWWNKEKSLINWDLPKEQIFLNAIERNSVVS